MTTNFIIYDPTSGTITHAVTVGSSLDVAAMIASNTPAGMAAMEVPEGTPAIIHISEWTVQNGILTSTPSPESQLLAQAVQAQTDIITNAYNTTSVANVSYMNTTFPTDASSQQIFGHAMLIYNTAGAVPPGFFIVDTNFVPVPMTLDDLKGLANAIAAQVWGCFQKRMGYMQQINAATTVAQVQSIIWV